MQSMQDSESSPWASFLRAYQASFFEFCDLTRNDDHLDRRASFPENTIPPQPPSLNSEGSKNVKEEIGETSLVTQDVYSYIQVTEESAHRAELYFQFLKHLPPPKSIREADRIRLVAEYNIKGPEQQAAIARCCRLAQALFWLKSDGKFFSCPSRKCLTFEQASHFVFSMRLIKLLMRFMAILASRLETRSFKKSV